MSNDTEIELQRAFGRLEGKVEALLHEMRASNTASRSVVAELTNRIAKLETWKTRVVAYCAGVGFAVLTLGGLMWRVMSLLK